MNFKATDIITILAALAALAGTGALNVFGDSIEVWAPGWGKKTVAILTSVCYAAALIVYVWKNRTGAPATSIVANAPIVPPGTATLTAETPILATNISSTSALLVKGKT